MKSKNLVYEQENATGSPDFLVPHLRGLPESGEKESLGLGSDLIFLLAVAWVS